MAANASASHDLGGLGIDMSSMPRPTLTTHHSNSLPSSPYQHSRKLSLSARSLTPEKTESHRSPRSTRSESESGLRPGGRGPPLSGCQFETGMAFSRRRIPYSIGGDLLERPRTPPKKYLNPAEEDKLSGDMRELFDRILPSQSSEENRAKFTQKLEHILNQEWPGNEIKVHMFGSSGNKLCSTDSDVDICITTPMKALERVCLLAKALADHGMERVVCVPHAKVPIVKIWDPELGLACDMNVNNTLALENTRMIKTYVEIDERVRPLAMIIKHWTKRRILNDAALGGTLSSYTWICMILNFLQTRNPPVLPCLHRKPHLRLVDAGGTLSAFADDLESLRGFGEKNKETLGELLFHFFRRYAHEVDYERYVISVREGRLISKDAKKWHLMQNNRLCVEEPFNTERNLGNTADDISFRGVHLELRRAFDLLSEAKLDECCDQYTFPPLPEKVWEKPPVKPMPILSRSRSQSQSGRGARPGLGNRGGKSGFGQHRAGQGRRASSAAAMNKVAVTQVVARGTIGQEQSLQAHFQQLDLHDHLYNEYQILQAQEQELRAIQAIQAHAQAQLQVQAHMQGSSLTAPIPQRPLKNNAARLPANGQAPLSVPLRSGSFSYPVAYPTVPGTPHPNVHTNPSSPSMKSAQPESRRTSHRSSNGESAASPTLRSQSQPARPLPAGTVTAPHPHMQPFPADATGLLHYQHLRHHQNFLNRTFEMNQAHHRHHEHYRRIPMQPDAGFEENLPKYIGYYVYDPPPARPYRDESAHARVPAFNDLTHRYRMAPAGWNRLITPSRSPSPSPSIPLRDRSVSMRSAASAPPGPIPPDRNTMPKSGYRSSGPIIVDGSGGCGPHYVSVADTSRSVSRHEAPSPFESQGYNTPATSADMFCDPGRREYFGREISHAYYPTPSTPELGRPMHISRNEIIEPLKRRATSHMGEDNLNKGVVRPVEYKSSGLGLGIEFEKQAVRPSTNLSSPSSQKSAPPAEPSLPASLPAEAKSDASSQRFEKSLKTLPLLSPVREVRTPSPSTSRKDDLVAEGPYLTKYRGPLQLDIPPFSTVLNGHNAHPEQVAAKPNGVSSRLFDSPVVSAQPQTNGWQVPVKKGKKNKSKGPGPSPVNGSGEPLPVNEDERKGG